MSFYDGHKNDMVGEQIILRGKNWRSRISKDFDKIFDTKTGDEITLTPNYVWVVGELVLEDKYNTLSYVISNGNGETTTISEEYYLDKEYVLELSYSNLLKKLDESGYNTMLENKICVGMSKELVKLSWGKPKKINKSSYNEQWVYVSQYIYFEKNIVTSWN